MRRSTTEVGRLGEAIAARYLELTGYEVVARNVRLSREEIDVVARRGDLLCFVEVRLRRRSRMGSAVETIGYGKRRHLREAARRYLAEHGARCCRFDVIAIDWQPGTGLRLTHLPAVL